MKNRIKVTFYVAVMFSFVICSYYSFGSKEYTNFPETDLLIKENIEALSANETSGQQLRVRAEYLGYCWTLESRVVCSCPTTSGCSKMVEEWKKGAKQYRCFDMSAERFANEGKWTLSRPEDEYCDGEVKKTIPQEEHYFHSDFNCPAS